MGQYTSYYLYQKYEQREGQDPIPCTPNVYSIDGYGTKQRVVKMENDPDCGYVPPTPSEPIYRWYQIPITEDYFCASCGTPPTPPTPTGETIYRWVDDGFTCQGFDKWLQQKQQSSTDSGTTWTDTGLVSATTLVEANSSYCGYVPPTPTGATKINLEMADGSIYAVYCNSSPIATSEEIKNAIPSYDGNTKYYFRTIEYGECVERISCQYTGGYNYIGGIIINSCNNLVIEDFFNPEYFSLNYIVINCSEPPTVNCSSVTYQSTCIHARMNPQGVIWVPADSVEAYSDWYDLSSFIRPMSGTPITKYDNEQRICEGTTLLVIRDEYISYDNGLNWAKTYKTMTEVIPNGCATTNKIELTYLDNTTTASSCDSSTALTSGDTAIGQSISNIKNAVIGNCIQNIASRAFRNCINLSNVTIPNSVTRIESSAFTNCNSLTSVTIPDSVVSIGNSAFQSCTSLTSVSIGAGIDDIFDKAFQSCTSLTSITIYATAPPSLQGTYVFYNTNNCPIYVPAESVSAYKAKNRWSSYASRIQAIP